MTHCTGCGTQIHESAAACPQCGAPNKASGSSSQSKTTLAIVCFFLGGLGIHRFMVGKTGTAILQIFTLGGLGIWVLIDFIVILTGGFTDKDGNKIS